MIRIFSPQDSKRYSWSLRKGKYIIGRSAECDLIIKDDTVSRKHARIEILNAQDIILTDLNSHNGTIVNGNRIDDSVKIKPDDNIVLGSVELKLTAEEKSSRDLSSVDISEITADLSSATLLPIETALQPLPAKIFENPAVFKALSEFGRMLVMPDGKEEMLNRGLKIFQDIVPADRVAVFLVGREEKDISLSAKCIASRGTQESFTISRTILNELMNRGKAVLVSDPQIDAGYSGRQSIISSGIRSAMAVPLYDEDKAFGIFYVDTVNPAHHYTENYLRLTATFGNMLAAKMVNNRLLSEMRIKDILESELAAASQIQNQLLPGEIPVIEGYQLDAFQAQCKQVGGDLYDIVGLDNGRILFLVADVSENGIGAALLASNILAAFRMLYSESNFNILDATRRISKQLIKYTRPGDYATLFVGLLDPQTHMFRYLNAAHVPPLIVKKEGNIEHLQTTGIPIGALDIDIWKEETYEIKVGDLLLIFTDGIPEALNKEGEQFGNERLEAFISGHRDRPLEESSESILNEVNRFIGDIPRSDDITMVILRREN